jgi:hypothetical protein
MEDFLGSLDEKNAISITKAKAITFKNMADRINISRLVTSVFDLIEKAAGDGKYFVDIKDPLLDSQIELLDHLGFDSGLYEEDDKQYEEGFRAWISWETAEEDDE